MSAARLPIAPRGCVINTVYIPTTKKLIEVRAGDSAPNVMGTTGYDLNVFDVRRHDLLFDNDKYTSEKGEVGCTAVFNGEKFKNESEQEFIKNFRFRGIAYNMVYGATGGPKHNDNLSVIVHGNFSIDNTSRTRLVAGQSIRWRLPALNRKLRQAQYGTEFDDLDATRHVATVELTIPQDDNDFWSDFVAQMIQSKSPWYVALRKEVLTMAFKTFVFWYMEGEISVINDLNPAATTDIDSRSADGLSRVFGLTKSTTPVEQRRTLEMSKKISKSLFLGEAPAPFHSYDPHLVVRNAANIKVGESPQNAIHQVLSRTHSDFFTRIVSALQERDRPKFAKVTTTTPPGSENALDIYVNGHV